jgi:oligoendopeptidase F
MSETTVPLRKEIPVEHTWNRESVFATPADWEKERNAVLALLPQLSAFQGRLAEGAPTLLKAALLREEILRRAAVVLMYAQMHQAVDSADQEAAAMVGQAQNMIGQAMGAGAFFDPELLAIGQETLQQWMKDEPRLAVFEHAAHDLVRQQEHIRSAEVEELIGMLSEPYSTLATTAGVLTDSDFKFTPAHTADGEETELSQGSYGALLASPDREVRRSAWENYNDQFLAYKNTLASNLAASVKVNVFFSRARRHENTLKASLFANNIPVEVFESLLDTFKKNLPTWHRYFAVRAKALGVNDLQFYDMWAPLTPDRPKVTYPQAVEWICAGLEPLGRDYVETIRKGCLEQRWVDIYPNQGKFSGAFSYGSKGTYPFIVMSYTDEIFSLSTLAHELGHSMHSYLAWKNQPAMYGNYSLFVAEVASNFHQAMVRGYLLEHKPERDFQIALIEEAMANFYRYFFTMPTLARFELEMHRRAERGQGLNADGLVDLLADLYEEAYGSAVKVDRPRYGIHWATFSHLYADYYVYQYATGISGANALSRRILSGTPGAAGDYLKFLSAGSSLYPLDALKLAGVDLTQPGAVEETFAVLAGYVEKLEKLVG